MWEQKAIVRKEVVFSAAFLFSYRGISGWTKGSNMKTTAMWSFGPVSRLWSRSLTRRWSVLQFSTITGLMRAKCHFQHFGTISDVTSINKMIFSLKKNCCICEKGKGKKFSKATQDIFREVFIWLKLSWNIMSNSAENRATASQINTSN